MSAPTTKGQTGLASRQGTTSALHAQVLELADLRVRRVPSQSPPTPVCRAGRGNLAGADVAADDAIAQIQLMQGKQMTVALGPAAA
jgi:hypothetical protein